MIEQLVLTWIVAAMIGYSYLAVSAAWHTRPMVGYDPETGRYRSVRRMATERAR